MKILLTNDDGYLSEGIILLRKELEKYGEVFMVAPKDVQSAKSVAITCFKPYHITTKDEHTFIVEGTPADCVVFGLSTIEGIDLVVSGCNNSPNMGVDTIYSGTCAACTQALIAGIRCIAFSCANIHSFNQITKYTKRVMDYILEKDLLSKEYFLNVNFPSADYNEAKGIKITKLYYQNIKYFTKSYVDGEFMSDRIMNNDIQDVEYDMGAFNSGYISITPMARHIFNEELYLKVLKKGA